MTEDIASPAADDKPACLSAIRHRWRAIVLSLLVAAIVSGVSLWSARNTGGVLVHEHLLQRWLLGKLDFEVRRFHKLHDRFPDSREELVSASTDLIAMRSLQDPWGRDDRYEKLEQGYRFSSLGRDGLPGGVGFDVDFATDNPSPGTMLSWWQFVFEIDSQFVAGCCLLSGLLAGVLTCRELRIDTWNKPARNVGMPGSSSGLVCRPGLPV